MGLFNDPMTEAVSYNSDLISLANIFDEIFNFAFQDESFANILINNPHVTLIRKGNTTETQLTQIENGDDSYEERSNETFYESFQPQSTKSTYMPTPTRRGEVKCPIGYTEKSEKSYPFMWNVSDESFLEMEKLCESPQNRDERFLETQKVRESPRKRNESFLEMRERRESLRKSDESFLEMEKFCESPQDNVDNTTLLDDVEAPSFLIHDSDSDDSVFEPARKSVSILSPMKLVGLRRPSTILEESTIQSINSSEERSSNSLSLNEHVNIDRESSNKSDKTRSYRPSVANVFPTMKGRIGFYDILDSPQTRPSAKPTTVRNCDKENSINLMRFDSIERELSPSVPVTPTNGNNSVSLIRFDSSVDETSFSNLSVEQTDYNSSMSDSDAPDQFNDTLEAVDYYMKQGKKIMDKTGASATFQQQQQAVPSPKSRNNSLLKQTLARRHLMSMNGDNNLTKKLF